MRKFCFYSKHVNVKKMYAVRAMATYNSLNSKHPIHEYLSVLLLHILFCLFITKHVNIGIENAQTKKRINEKNINYVPRDRPKFYYRQTFIIIYSRNKKIIENFNCLLKKEQIYYFAQ